MTMLRCAVLDDYQKVALSAADWSLVSDQVDVQAFHTRLTGEDELVRAAGAFDIIVAMRERTRFPASVFARLPRLRLLITTGMRNAAIDVTAAATHGVTVCGTASLSEPPAELTWGLILALMRRIPEESQAFRTGGPWQQTVGEDLHGRRLGLLGFGRIGTKVARVGRAFGMEVQAWSQNLTPDRTAAEGVQLAASKDELLSNSDIVSIHLILSARTRGLIGEPELRRMPASAYLVNTSRAPIVDEAALIAALREGWIAGAALDVFDEEPVAPDHPFRSMPNVLATPHLGYVSRANYRVYYQEAVEDIAAFLRGEPIRTIT